MKQQPITLETISERVRQHVTERNWQNNPPRGLAISIALEAGELLEHYQWNEKSIGDKEALGAELADVFIYAFQFAEREGIDIVDAIYRKLEKAAQKYPAELFQDKSKKAMHNAWLNAKMNHRKEGL